MSVYDFKIEFLRKGKAYNQLLSPVTDYMALCGDHEMDVVHVPYEHWRFVPMLEGLRYVQKGRRETDILAIAQDMAAFLGSIQGFSSEITKAKYAAGTLCNVRLVVSAAELALLPFEFTYTPDGCPGGGQHLLLQNAVPVVLTREVRRPGTTAIDWTRPPRVLFVFAEPAGQVPWEAHLKTLRRVVDPWVRPYAANDAKKRQEEVEKVLTVLPNASIKTIQEAYSRGRYTHVHILAHGDKYPAAVGERFGLALHDSNDPSKTDVVGEERLATALQADTGEGPSQPLVVTMASCDSGNVGTVMVPGASMAHELHVAGIPMVVASQFPLSFGGSILMVEELYARMLRGEDPRVALYHLRRKLYARQSGLHDWASLVAYTELPSDVDRQLHRLNYAQELAASKTTIKKAQWLVDKGDGQLKAEDFERTMDQLDKALKALPDLQDDLTESTGMRGSLEKQKAELLYHEARKRDDAEARRLLDRQNLALKKAIRHYRKAFFSDLSNHWTGIQYLVLSAVVNEQVPYDLWTVVRVAAEEEAKENVVWAFGTLAELYMLGMFLEDGHALPEEEAARKALEYADKILHFKDAGSFEVFSTWRQFKRYLDWWTHLEALQPIAGAVVDLMQPDDPGRYV